MTWISDLFSPEARSSEDFYRNRWAHDRVVRSTHGVNCTGSCSWNIHVKQGIVGWELQALDYPQISPDIPPYEPRGCQRGISSSWYNYSPLRVKHPYVRGALLDLWQQARVRHPDDPLAAWGSIVGDPASRTRYQSARGHGGFRRASWPEVLELLAAANLHTIKTYGSDRIVGFSPIPAMSMLSYAAGARFLGLLGGVCLSFYDWYCDLPPASPEVWGEQTDVAESADWFHARMIATVGSNVLMTRTPDAHFLVEARHRGAKVVVFSPDFSQTSKVADEWVPIHQGQDGAFWMAVNHVILKEFHGERRVPYFDGYLRRTTDAPYLVQLLPGADGHYRPGPLVRAEQLAGLQGEEHGVWKPVVLDEASLEVRLPQGSMGHRWQQRAGQYNLDAVDARTGAPYQPLLTLLGRSEQELPVLFPDFSEGGGERAHVRHVPVRQLAGADGPLLVTTVYDLLFASQGVRRGAQGGDWPGGYDDAEAPFTPAWQERFTGVSAELVTTFARQWAATAERSEGRCMIIIGAGANHWYHNNLIYRACIEALMLCGCVGRSGGGWNHYVGQEKLAPQASWAPIAFASDWGAPPRQQNAPSFHYVHSDQWRYDRPFAEICPVADADSRFTVGHTMDQQVRAVRHGWLPFYPQFDRPNAQVLAEAEAAGAHTPAQVAAHVARQLKERTLRFAVEDPDAEASWPRLWYIWRGNALQASAKGHEYFLAHYLGVEGAVVAAEEGRGTVNDAAWHERAPRGKIDLVVDLNFRMDTSALYSDVLLPAATWYEKDDLSSTDLHSFIHPLQAAVRPSWEARTDWQIFSDLARETGRLAATHLPTPVRDLIATPLQHDTPGEIAQPVVRDWSRGETEPLAGKTLPNLTVVERDYPHLYERFVSLGPAVRERGLAMHGTSYPVADVYDEWLAQGPVEEWGGRRYPSLRDDRSACEAVLRFAPETNGELAYRAYQSESHHTGHDHTHLAAATRNVRYSFEDLAAQPRRVLTTPYWTGITHPGRTYAAFCQNVEEGIPWRTLTGRQSFYLDHEAYQAFGEQLPTYKPRADRQATRDLVQRPCGPGGIVLNYLTPHGKWHIHSTFGDTLRMETLSRGIEPLWLNDRDAEAAGIADNDWVEAVNDHGAVVTRACVSARIPRGICLIYHATERTVGVPRSPTTGQRGGAHNSLTRARLKPLLMVGGYAQCSYAFNYWGPPGVNRDTYIHVRRIDRPQW